MSRPKSPERIQRDLDKAILKERRERKRKECDAEREARLKKRLTRESVERNGVPKVQDDNQYFGLRDAIAVNELMWCESCDRVVREREMMDDICNTCYYAMEVNDDKPLLKAQEDKGLPSSIRERETNSDALAGQLTLAI